MATKTKTAKKTKTATKGKTAPAAKKTTAKKIVAKKTVSPKTATVKKAVPAPKQKSPKTETIYEPIRRKLIKQRGLILAEAEITMTNLPEQTIFPDLGDQASVETDRNFELRLRGREQRLLKKIDEALERIEKDTFGICESCGDTIGLKRLEARPVTTMCINCKTEQEADEKMKGD